MNLRIVIDAQVKVIAHDAVPVKLYSENLYKVVQAFHQPFLPVAVVFPGYRINSKQKCTLHTP